MSVLDASALLALILQEPGSGIVEEALAEGALLGTGNLSEVVAKLAELGLSEETVREDLGELGATVVPVDEAIAYAAGMLRPQTRSLGLSLGDRLCLALAKQTSNPVLTADRTWLSLDIGIKVRSVRHS